MTKSCESCGTLVAFGKFAERRGEIPEKVFCPKCINKKQPKEEEPKVFESSKRKRFGE